jgi:hypothetical protein
LRKSRALVLPTSGQPRKRLVGADRTRRIADRPESEIKYPVLNDSPSGPMRTQSARWQYARDRCHGSKGGLVDNEKGGIPCT